MQKSVSVGFVSICVWLLFLLNFTFPNSCSCAISTGGLDLLVVTVATEETDGYERFKQSIDTFGLNLQVFGMNEEWLGGDVSVTTGGAHKLNLLKQGLVEYKDRDDLVLLFTDSYDVIFAADKEEILSKFVYSKSKLVISTQTNVWPDKTLKEQYPDVANGYPYINSGGIIGYAPTFWNALNAWDLENTDDDQLYFTLIYLNETLRNELEITLDHTAQLIQNLNFAQSEVKIVEVGNQSRLKNTRFSTLPCVLHGNELSKMQLNRIGNYVPNNWHSKFGCRQCDRNLLDLSASQTLPLIQIAVFISRPVPFLNKFFDRISNLDYPKSRINIFIYNQDDESEKAVKNFVLKILKKYNKVEVDPLSNVDEFTARNLALSRALDDNCDYQLSIDGHIQLTNRSALAFLLQKNKKVIAPMVLRYSEFGVNFRMEINEDDMQPSDYLSIIFNNQSGIWNVACISDVYLSQMSVLREVYEKRGHLHSATNIGFCTKMMVEGIFMYVTNEFEFGRILDTSIIPNQPRHPELWQIHLNPEDWEDKYLHPGFLDAMELPRKTLTQPCPGVFIFPIFTEVMADHLVETMNDFGKWSNGQKEYAGQSVSLIKMTDIGYGIEWRSFLNNYTHNLVLKEFWGFLNVENLMEHYVARYVADEETQPILTLNSNHMWMLHIALNRRGVDFEGGGIKFTRYNCSIEEIPKGYAIIHPAALTHHNEGLLTTKGTRYIAISFYGH